VTRIASACGALVALAICLHPSISAAQETRAGTIAEAQAEKAKQLKPYQPNKAERIALDMKRKFLETPNGFYPWFDSVYSGGGFTLGGGYRRFYGDRTFWNARGLYSAKSYKRLELATDSLGHAHGLIDLHAIGGWRDATQVAFYGIGNDSTTGDISNFRMKQGYVGGMMHVKGTNPLFTDVEFQYEDYTLQSGKGSSPSIEDAYPLSEAPGLGTNPSFLHTTLTGGVDTRPSPGYARRGGLYAVSYESYVDPDGGVYTFDRMQAEVVHHFPIRRENWVVSVHGVVRTTLDDADTVPFFLMPSIGSGSTLRAYPSWRFRDRHSLLMSGEWRWIPSRVFMDLAIFYDTGKVASTRDDLNFDGLTDNVGVGVRFHGPAATPLRIELAHGSEGFNLVFSGAAAF
jgi:hypothetical protein